jgi:putative Holliday junction resolvase
MTDHDNVPDQEGRGRVLSLDIGQKRIGVAVCDETRTAVRALAPILRTNWKRLLIDTEALISSFDAKALVLGLPLNMDGSDSLSTQDVRRLARNFSSSLKIPVFLQDERLTTVEAEERLRDAGVPSKDLKRFVDSEAAKIILIDFLSTETERG